MKWNKEPRRKGETALQYYEAQSIRFEHKSRIFPPLAGNLDKIFPFSDDELETRIGALAKEREETFDQVIRMVGHQCQNFGLTFEELLFHHRYSGWRGPMTVSERQRNAAYKAWDTMRARKAEQQK